MHELRLMAVSEDGTYLVLASTGRGTRFMLPVDDRLRAAVRGQFSRLGQYEIEVENPLRPKEIQARIRSGETAEAISEISGIPIERVRWFEGPVLQEREYIAQQAQNATVRAQDEAAPGSSLEELVTKRIGAHQLETGDAEWDSWKREDRTWQIRLVYLHRGEERVAHWLYEPRHNSVSPSDEEAAHFSAPEPFEAPQAPQAPSTNVTPFAPRRSEPAPEVPRGEPYPAAQERTESRHPASEQWSRQEPRRYEPPRPMSGRPQTDQFGVPLTEERRRMAEERRRPAAETRHPRPGQDPYFDPVEGHPQRPEVGQRPEPVAPPPAPERPAAERPRAERPRAESPGFERPADERPAAERPAEPESPRLEERPSAPDRLDSRPARPAEPPASEPAPPAAEPPAQPERPRRQRATIDLNDTSRPRRATEQATPPAPAADQDAERPAPKRKGRGRRASVPSWDEIMFGSKKDD